MPRNICLAARNRQTIKQSIYKLDDAIAIVLTVWRSGRAHADLQKEKSPGHRVWGDGGHARGFHCRNGDATKH
jgi:hypothetical protein